MVVMKPDLIPQLSCKSLTIAAMELVVQEPADTMLSVGFKISWFTPNTTVGVVSSLAGAEIRTFLAPAFK
ncbi:Uncharacterised protein [Chlamydia trachomatis]|nr:Uncharacterised protein [Chlamydia trachomatis]